jgi:hypothetical protein
MIPRAFSSSSKTPISIDETVSITLDIQCSFSVYDAIEAGAFPKWKFGVQVIPEEREHEFDFGTYNFPVSLGGGLLIILAVDLLDSTKIVPEDIIPVQYIGTLELNRNTDNYFAGKLSYPSRDGNVLTLSPTTETEQVAFCTTHVRLGFRLTVSVDADLSLPDARSFPVSTSQMTLYLLGETSRTRTHRSRVLASTMTRSPSTSLCAPSASTTETASTEPTSTRTRLRTSPTGITLLPRTLLSRGRTPTTRRRLAASKTEFWDPSLRTTTLKLRCSTTRCLRSRRSTLSYVGLIGFS